jgi:CheY-like chemotaxis protein
MPAKVLLVEDDNNLREIYEARLMAEGYTIVTARDGEEALTVAKAEMPDLIISDVMMPRVSGFEMLDILRNTEGLKDVKVIMLTALGQADDKTRANSLGADRYLVKSQVTLEDIVRTSHELLEGAAPAAAAPATDTPAAPAAMPVATPVSAPTQAAPTAAPPAVQEPPAPIPASTPAPVAAAPAEPVAPPAPMPAAPTAAEEQANIGAQIQQFIDSPAPAPAATPASAQDDAVIAGAVQDLAASTAADGASQAGSAPATDAADVAAPVAPPPAEPVAAEEATPSDTVTIANKKIIQPPSGEAPKAPIHELLAREEAAGMHTEPVTPPAPTTTFSPTVSGPVASMPEAPAAPAPSAPSAPNDPNSIAL